MRLIDADAAVDRYYAEWDKKDICDGAQDRDWLKQCIDEAPIIDPEDLRPHGRWLEIPNAYVSVASTDGSYHGCATSCSACGEVNPNAYKTNYCPNCGAKMIEEVPNE